MSIEDYPRTIIFFRMPLWSENSHVFGLELRKLGFVVTFWRHDVPWSWWRFSVPEEDDIACVIVSKPDHRAYRIVPRFEMAKNAWGAKNKTNK